jgi:cytidylate kinase
VARKIIIAIDGPVGSGKSTVARRVAELLGYTHLDSGAMYRALALVARRRGIALDDAAALEQLAQETRIEITTSPGEGSAGGNARVLANGEDVTMAIRAPEMSQAASQVAVLAGVRRPLVEQQRRMGAGGGVVMEGRDIGTVVFPEAELKIFLDASLEERAERRMREHEARGEHLTGEEVLAEVRARDERDRKREVSPLERARDAIYVDCTAMSAEETARLIALLAEERMRELESATP